MDFKVDGWCPLSADGTPTGQRRAPGGERTGPNPGISMISAPTSRAGLVIGPKWGFSPITALAGLITRRTSLLQLRRLCWLLMVVVHAPGCIGAWRSLLDCGFAADQFGGCALQTLATLFFSLKVVDVAFLRLRVDRRMCVAWCVVIALLHVDVVSPDNNLSFIPEYTTLLATTCLAANASEVRRDLTSALNRRSSARRRPPWLAFTANGVWLDAFRPRCWVLGLAIFRMRAPPS